MHCAYCGTIVDDESAFCARCGRRADPRSTSIATTVLLLSAFVVLLVGAFAYVHREAAQEQPTATPAEPVTKATPAVHAHMPKRARVAEEGDARDVQQVTLPASQVATTATETPNQANPGQLTPDPSQDSQPLSPTVFVEGTGNIDVRGIAVGGRQWGANGWANHWASGANGWASGWAGSYATQDFHNQTMELAKTFLQRCPQVRVTISRKRGDYLVSLNHQAFHGIIHKNNQIMVARKDGQVILSTVARSVGRNVTDACAAIVSDWNDWGAASHVEPAADSTEAPVQEGPQPGPPMREPSQIERDRCVDQSGNVIC